MWAANFGALEWHPWTSRTEDAAPADVRADRPRPRRATPRWDDLLALARCTAPRSSTSASPARPKVTGRRGIQIWIPSRAGYTFDETRAWVEQLSRTVGAGGARAGQLEVGGQGRAAGSPGWTTPRTRSTRRSSRRTARAPAPGAPVSVPIEWDELDDPELRPDRWTIRTVLDRLEQHGDPFRVLLRGAQQLPACPDGGGSQWG